MRRPSLRNLPLTLWKVLALLAVFALGALFDRHLMPWIRRDVGVWVIHGVKGDGCKGDWGSTPVLFGRPMGQGDGFYAIPCGEISSLSDTTALLCDCR